MRSSLLVLAALLVLVPAGGSYTDGEASKSPPVVVGQCHPFEAEWLYCQGWIYLVLEDDSVAVCARAWVSVHFVPTIDQPVPVRAWGIGCEPAVEGTIDNVGDWTGPL